MSTTNGLRLRFRSITKSARIGSSQGRHIQRHHPDMTWGEATTNGLRSRLKSISKSVRIGSSQGRYVQQHHPDKTWSKGTTNGLRSRLKSISKSARIESSQGRHVQHPLDTDWSKGKKYQRSTAYDQGSSYMSMILLISRLFRNTYSMVTSVG
jgi:hypothetical protein